MSCARIAAVAIVVGSLAACPSRREPPPNEDDERLVVGRITTELHAFDRDGNPMKLDVSLEKTVREALAEAKALRVAPGTAAGTSRQKGARLAVRALVSPDMAKGELHAIVSARLDRTGSIPLNADVDAVRSAKGEGALDAKVYAAHLSKAMGDALRSLDAQMKLLRGGDGALVEALGSEEPAVRISAARALGERRSRDAVEPLCALLREEQGPVGEAAVGALAAIGSEDGVSCLIHWADSDERRLVSIIEPVATIGGEEAAAFLQMIASGHENPGIRRIAEHALEMTRPRRDR